MRVFAFIWSSEEVVKREILETVWMDGFNPIL